ncbi:glycerophosphodiester phosphodiesterase [Arthrobacter sp.]|uniref:glycerophosphodiester phosphodiesterase n=1 Tax=Arthrobacter sp. TaxID=1667 RepID=UPI003A951C20
MGCSRRTLLIAGCSAVGLAVTGCSDSRESSVEAEDRIADLAYPAMAAHRGGLSLYPESTMKAFEAIIGEYPNAVLEMDVRTLRDGTMVIFHDPTVGRIATNSRAAVAEMSPKDWHALRIRDPKGGRAQPAVFLDEVLERFGSTNSVLMIERKGDTEVHAFMEAIRPFKSHVILQDFNVDHVKTMTNAGFDVVQLTGKKAPELVPGVYALGIGSNVITERICSEAQAQGTHVWAWGDDVVYNDPRLTALGVDGFIVNDPSRHA